MTPCQLQSVLFQTTVYPVAFHRWYCLLDSKQGCFLHLPAIQVIYLQYVVEIWIMWESREVQEDGKPCDLGWSQAYWKWRRDSRTLNATSKFFCQGWSLCRKTQCYLRIALQSSKGLLKGVGVGGDTNTKRSKRYRATAEQLMKRSRCK